MRYRIPTFEIEEHETLLLMRHLDNSGWSIGLTINSNHCQSATKLISDRELESARVPLVHLDTLLDKARIELKETQVVADWGKATARLKQIRRQYTDIGTAGLPALALTINPLLVRLERGEASLGLYDAIMALE